MNRFAYRTTSLAVKALYNLSKAKITLHGEENIPTGGGIIFVINHFTRLETFVMPYVISKLTSMPVWSLADHSLFKGAFGDYLAKVGALSTKSPDRDRLIVKSLLTGEATWIIFPEGRMVKNKAIFEKGRFMISYAGGKRPPHTGAAILAMRSEFYRRRIQHLAQDHQDEAERLMKMFEIESIEEIQERQTCIVPVNLTYYPVRTKENILSKLAASLVDGLPERVLEELMTEGSMLLSGVDIDIRFGPPIEVQKHLSHKVIRNDISKTEPFDFDDEIQSKKRMRLEALKIMQEYMTAIYGMTTVNHDHLFASFLRLARNTWLDEDYLKTRVYLLASQVLSQECVHVHHSLESDQIHLLTDDRFHKYRDFLSVAIETGVLESQNGNLVRNKRKLSSILDFHRARIDNPVAVMANAIEPLTHLQHEIRKMSWTPNSLIKKRLREYLLKKDLADFDNDYAKYFISGESKGKKIGQPVLMKGRSRKKGVVLVHGYMSAPAEVKELGVYLARRGYWVYIPRLKGHGTAPEDLAAQRYTDWVLSVERGYGIISNLCEQVVIGGFSTGAGLALYLASKMPTLSGVFAVSPPMRLQDLSSRLVPALDVWNRLMKKVQLDSATMEFVENSPENPHINYFRNPISGMRELERLMEAVAPNLPNIQMPAFVAQAKDDPVVDPKGSKAVFDRLGSQDKTYMLFNLSRHGILLGESSEQVHHAIADFVEKV